MNKLSLLLRKIRYKKRLQSAIRTFEADTSWIETHISPPQERAVSGKFLLVFLGDIGDYILFRNMLPYYCAAYPYKQLYLLGNSAWQDIFDTADAIHAIVPVWIDLQQYDKDPVYRQGIWQSIAHHKFDKVMAPASRRRMLLDDMCVWVAHADEAITGVREVDFPELSYRVSGWYTTILQLPEEAQGFEYNRLAAEQLTKKRVEIRRPYLPRLTPQASCRKPYIGLYIDAGTTGRWGTAAIRKLVQLLRRKYPQHTIYVIGKHLEEIGVFQDEKVIQAGYEWSLKATIAWMQYADLLVSNSVTAYHVACASGMPAVILANGTDPYGFSSSGQDTISQVQVIAPVSGMAGDAGMVMDAVSKLL